MCAWDSACAHEWLCEWARVRLCTLVLVYIGACTHGSFCACVRDASGRMRALGGAYGSEIVLNVWGT